MKKQSIRSKLLIGLLCCVSCACSRHTASITAKERTEVQDSVQQLTASIARDISKDGPVAWLKYFENSPDFFMASDGQLVFPNLDTATKFIRETLVKSMPFIKLQWHELRIDPLTPELAVISAGYHEDISDSSGKMIPYNGYFTAVAHRTSQGWKLHNAHWSSLVID